MKSLEQSNEGQNQEKNKYVLWERGFLKVMSDGSVISNMEAYVEEEAKERKLWEDYLVTLPSEEAEEKKENKKFLEEALTEFRKKYPIGGRIDMGEYLKKIFGSLEFLQKLKHLYECEGKISKESMKLSKMSQQGKDVNKEYLRNSTANFEARRDIENFLAKHKLNPESEVEMGEEALKIIKMHPDGEILYSYIGEAGRSGDSSSVELITKHGDSILLYEAVCKEYGQGTDYKITSVRDATLRDATFLTQ